jgi:hypothetical protein
MRHQKVYMTLKNMKSGDHPIRKERVKKTAARKPARKTATKVALFKRGRPARQDNPQKLTLHLALEIKRRAFDLATARRCSIGRLVEDLIAACKE